MMNERASPARIRQHGQRGPRPNCRNSTGHFVEKSLAKYKKLLTEANSDLQWLVENLEGLDTLLNEMQDAAQGETVSIKNLVAIKTLTEDCFTRAKRAHGNVKRVVEDMETAKMLGDE